MLACSSDLLLLPYPPDYSLSKICWPEKRAASPSYKCASCLSKIYLVPNKELLTLSNIIRSSLSSTGLTSMKVITMSSPSCSLTSRISSRSRFCCRADLFQAVFKPSRGFLNSAYRTSHTTISRNMLRTILAEIFSCKDSTKLITAPQNSSLRVSRLKHLACSCGYVISEAADSRLVPSL